MYGIRSIKALSDRGAVGYVSGTWFLRDSFEFGSSVDDEALEVYFVGIGQDDFILVHARCYVSGKVDGNFTTIVIGASEGSFGLVIDDNVTDAAVASFVIWAGVIMFEFNFWWIFEDGGNGRTISSDADAGTGTIHVVGRIVQGPIKGSAIVREVQMNVAGVGNGLMVGQNSF